MTLLEKLDEIQEYCESTRQDMPNMNSRGENVREIILEVVKEVREMITGASCNTERYIIIFRHGSDLEWDILPAYDSDCATLWDSREKAEDEVKRIKAIDDAEYAVWPVGIHLPGAEFTGVV